VLALLNPAETAAAAPVVNPPEAKPFSILALWTPLVLVMFCYGGWNDLAMVASEIESPKRNLWRSIVFGVGIVIAVYVAFNVALWVGLGYSETASSQSAAIDLVEKALGGDTALAKRSADLIAGLVCISCLGAINGMIITSPRIYYAVGKDYTALSFLSQWSHERSCPWQAIAIQAVVTSGLLLLCSQYKNVFEVLANGSAPYFWIFLGLTCLSLFRFRKNGKATDAVLAPLFPLPPIFFAIVCVGLSVSSTLYLISEGHSYAAIGIGLLMLVGVGLGMVLKSNKQEA